MGHYSGGGNDIDKTGDNVESRRKPKRSKGGAWIVSQKLEVMEELIRAVKEHVKVVVVWIPGPRRD